MPYHDGEEQFNGPRRIFKGEKGYKDFHARKQERIAKRAAKAVQK